MVGLEWYPCSRRSLEHGYHSNPIKYIIASDIKLVFYSSTITMTHSPINIRLKSIFYILYFLSNCACGGDSR